MWGNLHKHASLLPPPLFMINEIRVAVAHTYKNVIADNCLSLPKLEVASFGVCFNKDLLNVMKLCLRGHNIPGGTVHDVEMWRKLRLEWRREEEELEER